MQYFSNMQGRHEDYTEIVRKLVKIVAALDLAYSQTQNEMVLKAKQETEALLWAIRQEELGYIDKDFAYLVDNINQFPHSVRVWVLDYFNQEIS